MNKNIEYFKYSIRNHKIATFSIVLFLTFLSLSLIITLNQIQNPQARYDIRSKAAENSPTLTPNPTTTPTPGLKVRLLQPNGETLYIGNTELIRWDHPLISSTPGIKNLAWSLQLESLNNEVYLITTIFDATKNEYDWFLGGGTPLGTHYMRVSLVKNCVYPSDPCPEPSDVLPAGWVDYSDTPNTINPSVTVTPIPTTTPTPTPTPLLSNASFEIDNDANKLPDLWLPSNLGVGDRLDSLYVYDGLKSFKFSPLSTPSSLKEKISQKITYWGTAGDGISFDVWNRSEKAIISGDPQKNNTGVVLKVTYTDGFVEKNSAVFPRNAHPWSKKSMIVIADRPYNQLQIIFYNSNLDTDYRIDKPGIKITPNASANGLKETPSELSLQELSSF